MKPARFFMFDARAAVPFVIAMLHLRWYTLVFAFLTTLLFYFLELRGLSFFAALRAFRVWLITKKRPNIRHSDLHRWVDYAFEDTEKEMVRLGAMPVEPNQEDGFDMEKPAESLAKVVKKTTKKIRKKLLKKPVPQAQTQDAVKGGVKPVAAKTVPPAPKTQTKK